MVQLIFCYLRKGNHRQLHTAYQTQTASRILLSSLHYKNPKINHNSKSAGLPTPLPPCNNLTICHAKACFGQNKRGCPFETAPFIPHSFFITKLSYQHQFSGVRCIVCNHFHQVGTRYHIARQLYSFTQYSVQ